VQKERSEGRLINLRVKTVASVSKHAAVRGQLWLAGSIRGAKMWYLSQEREEKGRIPSFRRTGEQELKK